MAVVTVHLSGVSPCVSAGDRAVADHTVRDSRQLTRERTGERPGEPGCEPRPASLGGGCADSDGERSRAPARGCAPLRGSARFAMMAAMEPVGSPSATASHRDLPRRRDSYLMDMDGVLVHEDRAIPGAREFLDRLNETGHPYMQLTNNSMYTRRDLAARLSRLGLNVAPTAIWTSALATAKFLSEQRPGGSAYVLGESGLTTALHEVGYTQTTIDPDYVVLGEMRTYSFERIAEAVALVDRGARFIATNPDPTGPAPQGPLPATGSMAALISTATGVQPYFVGKPNPLMMRSAMRAIGAHSESTVMIGDRMDTDVVAGLESGMETVLVLTGISTRETALRFAYVPTQIVGSVADLVADITPTAGAL